MPERIRLSQSFHEKNLDPEDSPFLSLSLQISLHRISFSLIEPSDRNVVALECYEILRAGNFIRLSKLLEEFFQTNHWLTRNYESVRIAVEHSRSTLVPVPFYNPSRRREHLHLLINLDHNETVTDDFLPLLGARNLWAIHESLQATLRRFFPLAQLHHHSSVLIESLLALGQMHESLSGHHVIVNVRKNWFDLLVFESGKLILYNAFRYLNDEDMLYYLINVAIQLKLETDPLQVIFLGEIRPQDEIVKLAQYYAGVVQTGLNTEYFKWDKATETISEYQYFTLLYHYLCEL